MAAAAATATLICLHALSQRMDPQLRKLLEVAYEAWVDSGINHLALRGSDRVRVPAAAVYALCLRADELSGVRTTRYPVTVPLSRMPLICHMRTCSCLHLSTDVPQQGACSLKAVWPTAWMQTCTLSSHSSRNPGSDIS